MYQAALVAWRRLFRQTLNIMIWKGTRIAVLLTIVALTACGRAEGEPPTAAASAPLPASATQVRWSVPQIPQELTAGVPLPVTVTFTNIGDQTWQDAVTADPKARSGGYAVRLSHSVVLAGKQVAGSQHIGERVDLLKPVAPGESATLALTIKVPDKPGDYILFFELLQELVVWFADRGADVLTVPVKVVPASGR